MSGLCYITRFKRIKKNDFNKSANDKRGVFLKDVQPALTF
jgi:hypothetical protein